MKLTNRTFFSANIKYVCIKYKHCLQDPVDEKPVAEAKKTTYQESSRYKFKNTLSPSRNIESQQVLKPEEIKGKNYRSRTSLIQSRTVSVCPKRNHKKIKKFIFFFNFKKRVQGNINVKCNIDIF